ncbi:MAG: CRISPR-associated endonuclease Cas2 [Treponemataceae bacterium]
MEKWVIITYDIRDKRRLARTARCLSSYGIRLQRSIFLVHAEDDIIDKIEYRLQRIISYEDSVLFLPICEHDKKKVLAFGVNITENYMDKPYLIF